MRIVRVLLLSLGATALLAAPGSARQSISLDGAWECIHSEAQAPPPQNAAWEPVQVPGTQSWRAAGAHTLWYRKRFFIPSSWAGRRVLLTLDGVKFRQRVWLNGKEVGQHLGGFERSRYDITGQALVGGTNELVVAADDWTALIAPDAKVGAPDASAEFGSWVTGGLLAPLGSRGWEVGIWGSVGVEARPRVWVEDVFAAASVREQVLRVYVTVRNSGTVEERAMVSARISGGGVGPRFPSQAVAIPAGQQQVVTFEAGWLNPRLWSPEDPHLYSLVAGVRAGWLADSEEVRFGFREFWTEGDRFLLNGRPITLLAAAAAPQYSDPGLAFGLAKSAGCTAMALRGEPWPSRWYEAADEAGMLLISESALSYLSPSYALSRDEFWKNAQEHVSALVVRQRNHPSVVLWSAESELLFGGGAKRPGVEQKVAELAEVIRKADPTRPIMFEGDADPGGKADVINLHHPRELHRWQRWPALAYWFEAPTQLDSYPATTWQWDRKKPLYLGEFGRVRPAQADAATILLGDAAFPDLEASRLDASGAAREMQAIAARGAGVGGICAAEVPTQPATSGPEWEALKHAYQPVAAFVREASTRFFAGAVIDRTVAAVNDSPETRRLELRWRLAPRDEAWQVAGLVPLALPPGGRERVPIAVAVPEIAVPSTGAVFSVELWEGKQAVFSSAQEWKLYRRADLSGKLSGGPARAAVYDPKGETSALLAQLGLECLPITEGNAPRVLHFVSVAVIGKEAFAADVAGLEPLLAELLDFVRAGGRLLVFEQQSYPRELIPLSLRDHDSAIAFARIPHHPALAGIEPADLAEWYPDELVGRREIVKQARVGFLPIVDSGSPLGLETAGLAELRVGDGRMLLCQLDLTSKCGLNPVAAMLLRNLLRYAAQAAPRSTATGVFCDDAAAKELDVVGLKYQRLAWPLPKGRLRDFGVLLICNLESGISEPARVQEFVQEGGRVVLHQLAPETLILAQHLLGRSLSVRGLREGLVALADRSGPASGLSNEELAWFPPLPPGADSVPPPSAGIADYSVTQGPSREQDQPGLTVYTAPGLLASLLQGQGLWVIDQIKWQQAGGSAGKARRYLATLLTNLGCEAK